MMENNRAILRLCLTRKFWFFLLLLLSIFVTQRLSQTARNKRFETTSLRHTSGIEKNALVPDSGTNRMDRESKEI